MTSEMNLFDLSIFPIADMFPMVAADELAELAEDIKDNGLQEPIVVAQVNDEWVLIDGRNRLAACKLAEVTPHYRILESDPTAYVLSANVHRRHLTKGQQAMATALAYPDKEKGGRGKKSLANNDFSGASSGYIRQARFVLSNCRDKALEVLRNSKYPLTVAYEEAQAIVEEQRIAEEERQRQLAALAILREEYSDLAALVDDQRLGLPEAIAAGDQRREAARLKAEQEARDKADQDRREREELARQATLEKQVESIRQYAPDLADKMVSGGLSFDAAVRMVEERKANDKAKRDANLEAFYRLCEIAPSFTTEKGIKYFTSLLIDHGEEYRDRWRRSVKESLTSLKQLVDNRDEILSMIKEVLK